MPKSISRGSPRLVDQDVPGLDVAVDNSPPMSEGRRAGHLGHQRRGLAWRKQLFCGVLLEVAAADVLHHQVGPITEKVEVVNPDQVRMLQLGHDLPLLHDLATGRRARLTAWRA